jgi:outer membrane protein OmpA-like peptidoglycan-associated protein
MQKNMRGHLLFFMSFFLLASAAFAQPGINTDTKNNKAREHFIKAVNAINRGESEAALEEVEKALRKDPAYLDALMLRGDVLRVLKRYEASGESYRAALSLNSKLVDVHLYLAEMQFEAGWFDKSAVSAEVFLKTNPGEKKKLQAEKILRNSQFSVSAVENPVPFEPVNMGDNINTASHEYFPGITADGKYFIFTRRLDQGRSHEDFFISRSADSTWGPAYNLGPPVNTMENEGSVSISTDGQFIFFAACDRLKRNTLQGKDSKAPHEVFPGCDLYYTRLEGDKWGIPRHLGYEVNSPQWESTPSLSFDGLSLYFSSTRPGGYGGSDIWMSRFENGRFQAPVNLGPKINTAGNEQTPFIHPDDQTLYFSSDGWPGMGDFDFYYSRRDDKGDWGAATNLGYPINTANAEKGLLVNRSGDLAYFSSDSRPEGKGGVDLYQFDLYPGARPQELSYVKALVVDDITGEPLSASALLLDLADARPVIQTSTNSKTGEFLIVLQADKDYALNVSKEGYLFHSENFALRSSSQKDPFLIVVRLKKLAVDQRVVLKNVFFGVDAYALEEESKAELDKLVEFMERHPGIKIELGGHTDNTGNRQNNQKLSEQRAKSAYDYLVSRGVGSGRLSYQGFGDTKPLADNNTEEGRRQNRRTEYRITEISAD